MPSVLFVCTANQYRSPLATAYFRQELSSRGLEGDWTVESAGTWAQAGLPAALQAQQVAIEAGLRLDGHAARQVSLELLRQFDLVLAMESGQVEAMQIEFPTVADKIHLLAEAAGVSSYNIPDPFMTDEKAWKVAAELHHLIQQGFERITSLAREMYENSTKE